MNLTSEYFASLFRDLTNRTYTFSAIVFVAELSGNHSTPVSIFDLEVEGLTLGIIQAGAFLAIAQAVFSLIFALFVMDKAGMEKAFQEATSSQDGEGLFKTRSMRASGKVCSARRHPQSCCTIFSTCSFPCV